MLAGRCEGIEFESAGELELKGFPEPVEAFSVSWAPLGEEAAGLGRWPLPALLRSVPPVSYVGRLAERAALEEALMLARVGAAPGGAAVRRAGDRQDAPFKLRRPPSPRRGLGGVLGRVL